MDKDRIAVFRRMLDPKNWPVKHNNWFILDDDIIEYVSDDPWEEEIRSVFAQGRFQ